MKNKIYSFLFLLVMMFSVSSKISAQSPNWLGQEQWEHPVMMGRIQYPVMPQEIFTQLVISETPVDFDPGTEYSI